MNITTQSFNDAIRRRFPWVPDEDYTAKIAVRRVDEKLLDWTPSEEIGTHASGYYSKSTVTIRDINGVALGEVAAQSHDWNDHGSEDGETIGDALARVSDPAAVAYLTDHDYASSSAVSHDPGHRQLTIYKIGEFDLAGWLEARRRTADAEVAMAESSIT